ncbi:hypothetical protein LV89_01594 [Arcicella aurantiaca]|uniref:Uncharacterized protein n=1 Tax=Arcicella aurantiaca TaxID=591202 RepID=A0A316EVU9_9BACT|nr:hypothetical protein [Arcicella aurantiaca]PWK27281.1 hypothetical protein LV89_01594 [Arcicella aurantiaca]
MKRIKLSFVSIVFSTLFTVTIAARENEKIIYNPLLIDGQPINYEQFSLSSKGVITMITENTKGNGTMTIPFKVYLRRDNKIVYLGGSASTNTLSEIEISKVLKFANLGDELVIEPVDKKFQTSGRVFFLRNNLVKFMSKFLISKNPQDGC